MKPQGRVKRIGLNKIFHAEMNDRQTISFILCAVRVSLYSRGAFALTSPRTTADYGVVAAKPLNVGFLHGGVCEARAAAASELT